MRDILREIIPSITTGLCRDCLRKNRRIGVEPFSASETEDRTQKPVGNDFRPFIVPKSETAAVVRQNRNIGLIADLESAYAIGKAQHLRRINRDHGDHVLERKPNAIIELMAWVRLKRAWPMNGWFSSS